MTTYLYMWFLDKHSYFTFYFRIFSFRYTPGVFGNLDQSFHVRHTCLLGWNEKTGSLSSQSPRSDGGSCPGQNPAPDLFRVPSGVPVPNGTSPVPFKFTLDICLLLVTKFRTVLSRQKGDPVKIRKKYIMHVVLFSLSKKKIFDWKSNV